MYCSINYVKNLDIQDITEGMTDDYIEKHIEIAVIQVDYLTQKTFTGDVPVSVEKATAFITLSLLQDSMSDLTTQSITEEKAGSYSVKYNNEDVVYRLIPENALRLLKPYINRRKPFIDMV
jgi:hypothetical protein